MNIKDLAEGLLRAAELAESAEFHAYSVRQLQAREKRILAALDLIGCSDAAFEPSALATIVACMRQSQAQFSQDVYAAILSGGRRDGFFVEFGACDGKVISNTLTLETLFGWRGILAEPLPKWHSALSSNRSCIIETRCVWSSSGEKLRLRAPVNDQTQASIMLNTAREGLITTDEVETVSLIDLLDQHNAPAFIDFMSVDVEGGEFEVLRAFDFTRYSFGFLTVETHDPNFRAIEELFSANGYARIMADVSGHDSFFVPTARKAALSD